MICTKIYHTCHQAIGSCSTAVLHSVKLTTILHRGTYNILSDDKNSYSYIKVELRGMSFLSYLFNPRYPNS